MDGTEDSRDPATARSQRLDVQSKLYNFLNRSAQSLSRSNSQSGRTRRAKDKEPQLDTDRDPPRVSHATPSRLPLSTGNMPETGQGSLSSSVRTSRLTSNSNRDAIHSRYSSSPPVTPLSHHKHTLPSAPHSNTSTTAHSYNTPPQTPARSRKYSSASSPTSVTGGRDLLITRPLARPITPSNSSTSKKVFGIPIPSPSPRKATLEVEQTPQRYSHKLREGSGSSNEPLLHDQSPSSESGGTLPRSSISASRSTPRPNRTTEDRTPLPTPSSLPRSQRSATSHEKPPASPTTSSRRGTPRLDFWRSITPRAPSAQGEREKDKDKHRAPTPDAPRGKGKTEQLGLVTPQPRAPVTFLPRFQRTPATPRRGEENDAPNTVRLDSFMSDSIPVQQSIMKASQGGQPSGLTRQPTFSQNVPPHPPRTPGPERKPAPALGIQRSNSAPGNRGRLSPCLRIPSPKFLTRERSKEREKEKNMHHEKRRVTPESVGAPILREPRAHVPVPAHTHVHVVEKGGLKAPKTSIMQLRRAAHGTFDFERPGSRTSSKSGQSESRGTRSDDERDKDNENENEVDRRPVLPVKSPRPSEPLRPKLKAPSPVPPLPISRLKPRSPPPPRVRSPLTTLPSAAAQPHVHIDDSALPRLSSSLARRNSSSNQHTRTHAHGHRTPSSLPQFSFEPAVPVPTAPFAKKPARDAGGQYVDTRTGLIMYASRNQDDTQKRFASGRRVPGTSANGHAAAAIPQRELDEATVVITQFKSALDEAGFATLQKYVRRYDAQIIPLEGAAGLLARVQRLLDTSAPRVDERRKRQLYESFVQVVSQVS